MSFEIHCGDALDIVKTLPQVHCVVTSPPYFFQRKYGDSNLEIGRESDVQKYLTRLCDVFDIIPLAPWSSVWVNLGDKRDKNGNLMMVPERFVLGMQQRGWLLADKVIWAKIEVHDDGSSEGGCFPEPASSRLNGNGFEFLFRFVRTKKISDAWTDTCSVRIPRVLGENGPRYLPKELMSVETAIDGRNLSNVWRVSPGQTRLKHYAVYPKQICERAIAMTCPMRICSVCGHVRTRITEAVEYDEGRGSKRVFGKYTKANEVDKETAGRQDYAKIYVPKKMKSVGWSSCDHNDWAPGIVLDPFAGSGTTGEVALSLGRNFVGIDLYQAYAEIIRKRCESTATRMCAGKIIPFELEQ